MKFKVVKPEKSKKKRQRCAICGRATKDLTKTDCCGQWVCLKTTGPYGMAISKSCCWTKHDRYTLCAAHYHEKHSGSWKDCKECREMYETEMYVWYGTNEHNWDKLENPPEFKPKICKKCGKEIYISKEAHTTFGNDYWCERCMISAMKERQNM